MPAPTRNPPALCEVCGVLPCTREGVGFPAAAGVNPGLPEALRGGVVWVCGSAACREGARHRALRAAGNAGLKTVRLCRVIHFPTNESKSDA